MGPKRGTTIHAIKVRFLYSQTNAQLRSAVFHGFAYLQQTSSLLPKQHKLNRANTADTSDRSPHFQGGIHLFWMPGTSKYQVKTNEWENKPACKGGRWEVQRVSFQVFGNLLEDRRYPLPSFSNT